MSEKNKPLNNSSRFFYVFLTEKLTIGHKSNHTPQHITLVPPFTGNRCVVLELAKKVASTFNPFDIKLDGRAMIGPKNNISVITVRKNKPLQEVHLALLDELDKQRVDIGYIHFIRDEFKPHITIKKYLPDIDINQTMLFDHIAVIEKINDIKTILAINKLDR